MCPESLGGGPVAAARYSTDRVDEADDFLRRTYWDYDARLLGSTEAFRFDHVVRSAGPCVLLELEHNQPCEHTSDRADALMVLRILRGRVERKTAGESERFGPGDVFLLAQPGDGYALRWEQLHAQSLVLSAAHIPVHAPSGAPRFARLSVPKGPPAQLARRTFGFIDKVVLDAQGGASSPLVLANAARLVASTVVSVLGAEGPLGGTGEAGSGPSGGGRATLRRALEFIESNTDRDLALTDIAAAAYATPRSVQLAFRRYLDTTPMAHVRRSRLERAHEELASAGPGDGVTVTAVASRWGFGSMGRFAKEYREAYGVLPRETLHS